MAKKGHRRTPPAVQGTLFGPTDVYGGVTPAVGRPDLESPCGVCGHPLGRHTAQGEGLCLDCGCGGWVPPPAAGPFTRVPQEDTPRA